MSQLELGPTFDNISPNPSPACAPSPNILRCSFAFPLYGFAVNTRDLNKLKKLMSCLACGRRFKTDRCHRICAKCKKKQSKQSPLSPTEERTIFF